jgi:hypothetical protein
MSAAAPAQLWRAGCAREGAYARVIADRNAPPNVNIMVAHTHTHTRAHTLEAMHITTHIVVALSRAPCGAKRNSAPAIHNVTGGGGRADAGGRGGRSSGSDGG